MVTAPDGTRLAHRVLGAGDPLVCLPGGPMQATAYLDDLGGLARLRRLVLLDLRGTGGSAVPEDPGSYRCDRQVADVEALRIELGLERLDLLAHSGGANLAVLYAARHPERVRRLVLVTPGCAALGVVVPDAARQEVAGLRAGEAWFPAAAGALGRVAAGTATGADWGLLTPFQYARWDAGTEAHHALGARDRNDEAAAAYASTGAFEPAATRAALADCPAPVLVLAGEWDVNTPPAAAAEVAGAFPGGELVVLPRVAHYPWRDDPEAFVDAVARFVARR